MMSLGDILAARVAAQLAIAWLDDQQTEASAAQLERMQQLIRKLDVILDRSLPVSATTWGTTRKQSRW